MDETTDPGSDVRTLSVSLPLDRGFLRRQCPSCEREFKRLGDQANASEGPETLVCPYCYESHPSTEWWTPTQTSYFHAIAYQEMVAPKLREFQASLRDFEVGGLLSLKMSLTGVEQPAPMPPIEGADMTRVEFPCHPEEPLRVASHWEFDVACTVCGTRYPLVDVRRADPSH